ncbi:hypothetical protein ABAZ39_07270 [Azospirillum argentinense]|uniref:Uncharacterized protein n=1 Tax=Azospirillum argentinense TaxID=2970906 RepID=A0A060DGE9_9PROT|nr:hypothetical protein [Azospirillum argentinense]AIB11800.1 hypothetical protein ABAZ39_07270 [Azospirillum argentinense]EZQ08692.1 hypothetical protein ABAZ39_08690 [Azospirillum argentinense]
MARKKSGTNKAEVRRARAKGLTSEQFFGFVDDVKEARQELDDANTAHATTHKKADGLGIHPQAVKLYLRLDKMEDTKRNDFLRAFDQYRGWAGHWSAQADLYEQPGADATPLEEAMNATDRDSSDEPKPLGDIVAGIVADAKPAYDVASPSDLPGAEPADEQADWGDEGSDETNAELENAGFTFAEGRKAGQQGAEADANPHPAASPSHAIWERGRVQGAADEPAEDEATDREADEGGEQEPAPARAASAKRGPAEKLAAYFDGFDGVEIGMAEGDCPHGRGALRTSWLSGHRDAKNGKSPSFVRPATRRPLAADAAAALH